MSRKLVECQLCHVEVDPDADRCPGCGTRFFSKARENRAICKAIVIMVIVGSLVCWALHYGFERYDRQIEHRSTYQLP